MRKIEQQMIAAIKADRTFSSGNTSTGAFEGGWRVFLHGSVIARVTLDGVEWTLAGWNTPTTRSRINALVSAFGGKRVSVRAGVPYADDVATNDKAWN